MRTLSLFVVAAAAAALAAPALVSAAPGATRGVVVQRDARAGVVVLATKSGSLRRVKLAKPNRLAMGALVQVSGSRVSVVGHSRRAKLRGVVVRRGHKSFALAGNGSVLAVASVSPPAAGQQITATVQVSPTSLSDDDGNVEVEHDQAPSAELRGTVLGQDEKTLRLSVSGFPAGLPIALGTQTIPALAVGTPVEVRVTLGPDPANADGIVLTLVSLHVENGEHGNHGDHHGSKVEAEGTVKAITEAGDAGGLPGSITVAGEHGDVTFTIPAGFGPTGVAFGDQVEAKGTAGATPADAPTLVRLESSGDDENNSGGNDVGGDHSDGSGGDD
jgi:hypothetical protein